MLCERLGTLLGTSLSLCRYQFTQCSQWPLRSRYCFSSHSINGQTGAQKRESTPKATWLVSGAGADTFEGAPISGLHREARYGLPNIRCFCS